MEDDNLTKFHKRLCCLWYIGGEKIAKRRIPLKKRADMAKKVYRTFLPLEKMICVLLVLLVTSSNTAVLARRSGLDEVAEAAASVYFYSATMILALALLYFALYAKDKEQIKEQIK